MKTSPSAAAQAEEEERRKLAPLTQADHGISGLVFNSDDAVTRPTVPTLPASPHFHPQSSSSSSSFVASKDVTIQPSSSSPSLWARMFLPRAAAATLQKLPIVLYFHGGGFVGYSCASSVYHTFCERLAKSTDTIVVSVEYRLAPEHRLPAAYEDAAMALKWVQMELASVEAGGSCEPWLASHADPSRCFLMGDSAGGNIVHHLSLRVAHMDLKPLKISGHILLQPFFGGTARTSQELILANDKILSLKTVDFLWKLALPKDADRDHPMCNPLLSRSSNLKNIRLPKTLIAVGGRDPMCERQLQYFKLLKDAGKDIKLVVYEEAHHAFQLFGSNQEADLLFDELDTFLQTRMASKI
ncbi:hypothetical protein O6H91_07G049500 [Diphasiastrum complanatum]|uniref:Uncharacterized protein n=1 Tax=Diphasiastrum complanatum TaxID=34168 RepID=A0ACC2D503_DIPCM|nr:hypothetical protein O6H91_07G049500 [Diphasiastrum complanatum]